LTAVYTINFVICPVGQEARTLVATKLSQLIEPAPAPEGSAEDAFHRGLAQVAKTEDRARTAFFARTIRAAGKLAAELPAAAIETALAEETSLDGLIAALLADDEIDPSLLSGNEAFLRGARAKRKLLAAEGGALTAPELEKTFGVTRQHIHAQRDQGKLLGVQLATRIYRYPVWQFDHAGRALPGLDRILAALPAGDEWGHLIFFLEPSPLLGRGHEDHLTPLEALRAGRIDEVLHAASAWGLQ